MPPAESGDQTFPKVGYQIEISDQPEDTAWDGFLNDISAGHLAQTSVWGQLKGGLKRSAARVTATREGQIVGGAQLLIRPLPVGGTIAYIPRGPVLAMDDQDLAQAVMTGIHQILKEHRIKYLVVQPPLPYPHLTPLLRQRNYRPSSMVVASAATIQVDLQKPLADVASGMGKTPRRFIRRGPQRGLTSREGTVEDLPTFYRLMTLTCERQNFSHFPESYFADMWRLLHPPGFLKLFIVEHQGEPVSAQLVITFGNTVVAKYKGWSGKHKQLGPNIFMDWMIIEWAHSQAYHAYDFEGIELDTANQLADGQLQPHEVAYGPTRYKMNFGGQVVFFPTAYDYVRNPILRWGHAHIFPRISQSTFLRRLVHRLRTS